MCDKTMQTKQIDLLYRLIFLQIQERSPTNDFISSVEFTVSNHALMAPTKELGREHFYISL
jgi:hypothetical protein